MKSLSATYNSKVRELTEFLKFLKSKSLEEHEIVTSYISYKKDSISDTKLLLEFENNKEIILQKKIKHKNLVIRVLKEVNSINNHPGIQNNNSIIVSNSIIQFIKKSRLDHHSISILFNLDDLYINEKSLNNMRTHDIYNGIIFTCYDFKLNIRSFGYNIAEIILYFESDIEVLEVYENENYIKHIVDRFIKFLKKEQEMQKLVNIIREERKKGRGEIDKDEKEDLRNRSEVNFKKFLSNKENWVKNIFYESEYLLMIKIPDGYK